MKVTTTEMVIAAWVIVSSIGLISTIVSAISGWRDGSDGTKVLEWRVKKLLSVMIGGAGLFVALISYEKTFREFNESSSRYVFERYVNAKIYTTYHRAVACAQNMMIDDLSNDCFDFTNLDQQIQYSSSGLAQLPHKVTNWQKNNKLDEPVRYVNNSLENIWANIENASEKGIFDMVTRINIGFIAITLVFISFAGSVGEAVFQFSLEYHKRRSSELKVEQNEDPTANIGSNI